jgi:hypothetical protein
MAKIIITERQYNLIKEHISEEIDPNEAYRDEGAVQTVIDGKRDVGFLATYYADAEALLHKAKKVGLKVISMPQSSHKWSSANIIYRDGSEEEAMRLAKIAKRNGGYLPINTPEETYEIGILLGYYPEKVKEFVLDKFPDFKFY